MSNPREKHGVGTPLEEQWDGSPTRLSKRENDVKDRQKHFYEGPWGYYLLGIDLPENVTFALDLYYENHGKEGFGRTTISDKEGRMRCWVYLPPAISSESFFEEVHKSIEELS